jgi:hypothetical protein
MQEGKEMQVFDCAPTGDTPAPSNTGITRTPTGAKSDRDGWVRRLLSRFVLRRVAVPVVEESYPPNAARYDAIVRQMQSADVTCVLRCHTLAPPHVRRKRWRALPGEDALDLGQHMLRYLAGAAPDKCALLTVRSYTIRRWLRARRVLEFSVPYDRHGPTNLRQGVTVRFVERA